MKVLITGDSFLDDGIVSDYNMIKDVSWPIINSVNEFFDLPRWILSECYTEHSLSFDETKHKILKSAFGSHINMARSGAGNEYIAHSVIETCAIHNIDYVFVLWSGVSRIDLSFGNDIIGNVNENLDHCTNINNRNWMHCGGLLGSHSSLSKKNIVGQYIKTQHIETDSEYLTNISLYNVLITQAYLESRNIKYDFGWIYNPHIEYNLDDNKEVANELTLCKKSKLYDVIDWDKFLPSYPYNWCKENKMLDDDNFHPSLNGLHTWLNGLTLNLNKENINE